MNAVVASSSVQTMFVIRLTCIIRGLDLSGQFMVTSVIVLQRNGSHSGEYVYLTGEKNYKDYARIDTWEGQRSGSHFIFFFACLDWTSELIRAYTITM